MVKILSSPYSGSISLGMQSWAKDSDTQDRVLQVKYLVANFTCASFRVQSCLRENTDSVRFKPADKSQQRLSEPLMLKRSAAPMNSLLDIQLSNALQELLFYDVPLVLSAHLPSFQDCASELRNSSLTSFMMVSIELLAWMVLSDDDVFWRPFYQHTTTRNRMISYSSFLTLREVQK
ncbi:hypothetical protein Tco_1110438 [Tanacetum coccineum]|uniref:Uncharacterized protein n=1 Tax=Tanacetum coccineum TaxID=301880 RepID=A0ABQ5IK89_9ASTR